MKTFDVEPALKSTLDKLQDFLSTQAPGARLETNVLRGIRSDFALVESTVEFLVEQKVLAAEDGWVCPNSGCGSELVVKEDHFYCTDCDESIIRDEACESRLLILSDEVERTIDGKWNEPADSMETFFDPITGRILKGERDDHYVYLLNELPTLTELRHETSLLKLCEYHFQPEYGQQRRRHVYSYIETKGTITMNQNVHFNGNNNSVGSINQQNLSAGVPAEVFNALIADIQKAAADNNVRDERLIKVLELAISNGSGNRGLIGTLNNLVSLAADYSTVIGPFVPQITALLAAIPKV